MTNQAKFAELASEYWKLLQAFERCAALAPESAKPRLAAQARYSGERLKALLERDGMRIVTFDGVKFEVNLPAVAVNAEDCSFWLHSCFRNDEPAKPAPGKSENFS